MHNNHRFGNGGESGWPVLRDVKNKKIKSKQIADQAFKKEGRGKAERPTKCTPGMLEQILEVSRKGLKCILNYCQNSGGGAIPPKKLGGERAPFAPPPHPK